MADRGEGPAARRRIPTLVMALAGATAAVVLAVVIVRQTGGPDSIPQGTANGPVESSAPGPSASTPAPATPAAPTRAELVAQLALFEPPEYLPPNLPGAEPRFLFATAMEHYRAGDYFDAATALRQLLDPRAESPEVLFYLGISDLSSGRLAEGARSLQRVIALADPAFEEDARFFLSKTLLYDGDMTGARAELERVAALKGDRAGQASAMIAAIDKLPPA